MTFTKEHLYYIYANNNESNREKLSALCDSVGINCLDNENFKFIEIYSCDNGDSDDFELLDTNTPDSTSRFLSSDDIDEMLHATALEEKKPNQYESVAKDLPKKRTKVEYVSVKFEETMGMFGDEIEIESDLFFQWSENNVVHVSEISGKDLIMNRHKLIRRTETPMTEQEEFIDVYGKVRNEFANQSAIVDFCEFMYNSGKFKLVN